MSCEDLVLTTDINDACSSVMGDYEHVGYIFDHDNVIESSIAVDGMKATFHLNGTNGFKVYDRSFNPFAGCQPIQEVNERYVVFIDQAIIPLFVNNQINAQIANYLSKKRIVLMLENIRTGLSGDARYPIFGLIGGLKYNASTHDISALVAHDVTLQDKNTGYPALFFYDVSDDWTTKMRKALVADESYYYADGITVPNGTVIGVEDTTINSPADIFIKFPDDTVTNVGHAHAAEWTGIDGNVKMVFTGLGATGVAFSGQQAGNLATNIPKPVNIDGVPFVKVWANETTSISAVSCTALTEIHCKKAVDVDVTGCTALSVASLAQMILEVYAEGKINGTMILHESYVDINAVSPAAAAALTDMDNNRGWTISLPV